MTFLFSVLPFPTTESVQFLFSCSFRNAGQGLWIERQNCGREVCTAFLSFSISFKFINTTSQSLRTSEVVDLYVSRLYSYHDLEMQKIQEFQMQNNFFPAEKEESISRVQSSLCSTEIFRNSLHVTHRAVMREISHSFEFHAGWWLAAYITTSFCSVMLTRTEGRGILWTEMVRRYSRGGEFSLCFERCKALRCWGILFTQVHQPQ